MKLKINVTRNDIKNGACADARECAVASAINKTLRKGFFAEVCSDNFWVHENGKDPDWSLGGRKIALLNKSLRSTVREFDLLGPSATVPVKTKITIKESFAKYFKPSALEV